MATPTWERIIWPDEVEPGQELRERRTGRRVQVVNTDGRHAYIANVATGRRGRIELTSLVARFDKEASDHA